MPAYEDNPNDRQLLVDASRQLLEWRLSHGASGNVSVRIDDGMLITPTGATPRELNSEQIVAMDLAGQPREGQLLPSSEWHMHSEIYKARPDVQAVVHCHSRYATIMACAHKSIPPLHYMVAVSGGKSIPLASYETYGTEALAKSALDALGQQNACLLANHGQIALGASLEKAMAVAQEVEEMAALYVGAEAVGGARLLTDAQMDEVLGKFSNYGQQRS